MARVKDSQKATYSSRTLRATAARSGKGRGVGKKEKIRKFTLYFIHTVRIRLIISLAVQASLGVKVFSNTGPLSVDALWMRICRLVTLH